MIIQNSYILNKLQTLHYSLLILLILTLPYHIVAPSFSLLLSSLMFIVTAMAREMNIKKLVDEKVLVYLFLFITLIYISTLWSPAKNVFSGEFKATAYGYLNYYFLIPAIYFSDLSEKKLKTLFTFIIISPLIYSVIYFSNSLDLTSIYSTAYRTDGNSHLYVDLFANLFILFSAIFLYIKFLSNVLFKNYLNATVFFLLFFFFSSSLFINDITESRLINITFLILIIYTTVYIMPIKYKLISLLLTAAVSITVLYASSDIRNGFKQIDKVHQANQYEGSWGHRIKLAQYGLEMWKIHPYFGRGPTDVIDKMRELREQNPNDFIDPTLHFHNQHILILVQTGVFGYILFLLFIYYYFKTKIKNPEIHLYKNSTILIFLLIMNGEHYFQMVFTSTFFALLCGLFLAYKNQE